MRTEQSNLYRSHIKSPPITINGSPQCNLASYSMNNSRQHSSNKNFHNQASQKTLRSKHVRPQNQGINETLPFLDLKDVQNSFISIDDVHLNPKFNKKLEPGRNKILGRNLTDLHSDTQSIDGRSIRTYQGQDEYYKYWKLKAHEYLDQNFKLREENKKLRQEIQSLKNNHFDENKKEITHIYSSQIQSKTREEQSFSHLQNIFKKKLNEMENQIKEKSLKIVSLEDKVLQLNRKVIGEDERTQLIERLGSQIDTLTQQNISLKTQAYQVEQKLKPHRQVDSRVKSPYARYRSKERAYFGYDRMSPQKNSARR